MTKLTKQARDVIKWYGSIAGYTRHYFGDQGWGGDRCGCVDDRCIGFHHDDENDCQCLPAWLDDYVKAIASEHGTAVFPAHRDLLADVLGGADR